MDRGSAGPFAHRGPGTCPQSLPSFRGNSPAAAECRPGCAAGSRLLRYPRFA